MPPVRGIVPTLDFHYTEGTFLDYAFPVGKKEKYHAYEKEKIVKTNKWTKNSRESDCQQK